MFYTVFLCFNSFTFIQHIIRGGIVYSNLVTQRPQPIHMVSRCLCLRNVIIFISKCVYLSLKHHYSKLNKMGFYLPSDDSPGAVSESDKKLIVELQGQIALLQVMV